MQIVLFNFHIFKYLIDLYPPTQMQGLLIPKAD